ncbi:hypothetical protein N7520_011052 [Penicillium odoratum]|uniref:uncharacterized protein n=1 Tax=Penicillium odoratum TaxID=1167516 RepID=UPI0025481E83|nr:uncharacterized protein N7520_011052 [Penicillium odoratum]KAJ5745870.1 hypothetical protein N7520_011052 [Penicillium odoratum]
MGFPKPSAAMFKAMLINGAVDTGKKWELQDFCRIDLVRSMIINGKPRSGDFVEAEVVDENTKDQSIISFNMSLYMDDTMRSFTPKFTLIYTDSLDQD